MLQSQSPGLLLSACSLLQKSLAQHVIVSCGLAAVQATQIIPAAAAGSMLQQQRCKHEVRMVLLKDHKKLGKAGDIVDVKAGYARYTLFPRGEADYAVPSVIQDMRARGLLSSHAMLRLQRGSEQKAGAAVVDPSKLPVEQQIPQIVHLLSEKGVVISRRFNIRVPEEPMIGEVTAPHLVHAVAQQLKIDLPYELVMMHRGEPIKQFGSFRVPLNLQSEDGTQAELALTIEKTRRGSRIRQLKQKYLFATRLMQARGQEQQRAGEQQAAKQQTA